MDDPLHSQAVHRPAYTMAEAARYASVPVATLRTWVVGRPYPTSRGSEYFDPLITPAQASPAVLSFANVVEAHVLRALRTEHGVAIQKVRESIAYAEEKLGVSRLLLRRELSTHGGELFLDRYGALIGLSASGQLAMRQVLDEHLARIEWGSHALPMALTPFITALPSRRSEGIVISPSVAFGRPVVRSRGVSTRTIIERLDAGESESEIARDYGITEGEVQLAAVYERAA